jgi:hypothetical protein
MLRHLRLLSRAAPYIVGIPPCTPQGHKGKVNQKAEIAAIQERNAVYCRWFELWKPAACMMGSR